MAVGPVTSRQGMTSVRTPVLPPCFVVRRTWKEPQKNRNSTRQLDWTRDESDGISGLERRITIRLENMAFL